MVASPKTVSKAQEDKRFYRLEVVFDPKLGMQIKQDSNQVGPFDIMGALSVVHGMHQKYFVDAFSQQLNKQSAPPSLTKEQQDRFNEAMKKTMEGLGFDKDGNPLKKEEESHE